jgi:hypothetical protein
MLTEGIPRFALSVRQPWAWAIIHAGKDIENRTWKPGNPGLRFRGPLAIHAARGMTQDEYEDACDSIERICGFPVPPAVELQRGGIIGMARLTDIVLSSNSPWFAGKHGLVLTGAAPVPFVPAAGNLGFYDWQAMPVTEMPAPPKWMTGEPAAARRPRPPKPTLQVEDHLENMGQLCLFD